MLRVADANIANNESQCDTCANNESQCDFCDTFNPTPDPEKMHNLPSDCIPVEYPVFIFFYLENPNVTTMYEYCSMYSYILDFVCSL
jgi:hypothetical protein